MSAYDDKMTKCEFCGRTIRSRDGQEETEPLRVPLGNGYHSVCPECFERLSKKSKEHRSHIHLRHGL